MDVRGPTEGDANGQLSHLRNQPIRHEAHSGPQMNVTPGKSPHTASEISQLVEELQSVPEVREELVARMVEKLQNNELITRSSAEQAARAILGDEEE